MNWEMNTDIAVYIEVEDLLHSGVMPVKVVKEVGKAFPNVPKADIQKAVADYQEEVRKAKWCEAQGHKMVDDSYGGPESGYIGYHCTRCGFSAGQTLY